MLYELCLAQFLAVSMGGLNQKYAITIGIYSFSLGLGALHFDRWSFSMRPEFQFSFARLEAFLVGFAVLSGILLLATFQTGAWAWLVGFLALFGVGYLSGMELPYLFQNSEKYSNYNVFILSADYLGMCIACLMFPFLLLPQLGLWQVLIITAGCNLSLAICFQIQQPKWDLWLLVISGLFTLGLLFFYFMEKPILQFFGFWAT